MGDRGDVFLKGMGRCFKEIRGCFFEGDREMVQRDGGMVFAALRGCLS
jgi:hypothetical protein